MFPFFYAWSKPEVSFLNFSGDFSQILLSEQKYERFNPVFSGQQHSGCGVICPGCGTDFPDVLCLEISIRPRKVTQFCTTAQHYYAPPVGLSLCCDLPLYHVEHGAEVMELSNRVAGTYGHAPYPGYPDWRVAGYQDRHCTIFQAYGSQAGADPGEWFIHMLFFVNRAGIAFFVARGVPGKYGPGR
jgi:hypothetical protein